MNTTIRRKRCRPPTTDFVEVFFPDASEWAKSTVARMFDRRRTDDETMETVERFALKMLKRRGTIGDESAIERGPSYLFVRGAVLVYFVPTGKVTTEVVKTVLRLSAACDTLRCPTVVVYANSITPEAKHALESKTVTFQPFSFDELSFDLIDAVPEHSLVVGERPKDWRKYPIILSTDAVARYYGFVKDDVVRIRLEDGTLTYRRCV